MGGPKGKDGGKDMGKGKDSKKGKGGWKGEDGKTWTGDGKGKNKDSKDGKGKSKKADEWRGKGDEHWHQRDRGGKYEDDYEGDEQWVPKDRHKPAEEDAQVGAQFPTGRGQLSSSAPDFKPSGMFGNPNGLGPWCWQPAALEMPQLWKEYADKDGTKYYYNSRTGLSQWDRPAELDPPKPAPATSSSGSADGPAPATAERRTSTESGKDAGKGARRERDDVSREQDVRKTRSDEGMSKSKGKGGKSERRRQGGGKNDGNTKPSSGPPGCNLFVFHLPDDWADEDLLESFECHGAVISAKVMKEIGTGRSRGFGFVSYEDRVSAATAIKKMQGFQVLGKRLKVQFKKGEGDDSAEADDDVGQDSSRGGDDERLIGYLRAISAKSVVQSLKESERAADEDDDRPDESGDIGDSLIDDD